MASHGSTVVVCDGVVVEGVLSVGRPNTLADHLLTSWPGRSVFYSLSSNHSSENFKDTVIPNDVDGIPSCRKSKH